jgi:hypothetical protein
MPCWRAPPDWSINRSEVAALRASSDRPLDRGIRPKWAENIGYLLEDVDGVELFSKFLEQENIIDILPFYFAVKGEQH